MSNSWGVAAVNRRQCANLILTVHYAKRWPSISYAFGLFDQGDMIGAVTFGTPASAPLRSGICGPDYAGCVLELNRLVMHQNVKNAASFLVSRAMKMIGGNRIIVSFADTEQGHVGYVYQACNFIYCGLSAKRTDWKIRGMEHLHGQTIADKYRGQVDRAAAIRADYGEDFYLKQRSRKHRYIYFVGSKSFKSSALAALRYEQEPYPK